MSTQNTQASLKWGTMTDRSPSITQPNIFSFTELPEYLRAYTEFKKVQNPRWTLGTWSRRLGIKGSGTLSNFLSGRRVPQLEVLEQIKTELGLSEYESQYFDTLVAKSIKGINPVVRNTVESILHLRSSGEHYDELTQDESSIIRDPLIMILREAVKLKGFRPEPNWVRENLNLIQPTDQQINAAFETLLKHGLLEEKDGTLVQSDQYVKTPSLHAGDSINRYYEAALELNRRAIQEMNLDRCHYNSITLTCSKEKVQEMKKLIHEFSRTLMERFDEPTGDRVYQFHTQMIPFMEVDSE